jgi:hypothetical protein
MLLDGVDPFLLKIVKFPRGKYHRGEEQKERLDGHQPEHQHAKKGTFEGYVRDKIRPLTGPIKYIIHIKKYLVGTK